MGVKEDAYQDLLSVIKEYDIPITRMGRDVAGDPNFLARMADPNKTISSNTLDNVCRYILHIRGQLDLDLEKD
jgi:hypothetical protein